MRFRQLAQEKKKEKRERQALSAQKYWLCGKLGHFRYRCPQRDVVCEKCGRKGHGKKEKCELFEVPGVDKTKLFIRDTGAKMIIEVTQPDPKEHRWQVIEDYFAEACQWERAGKERRHEQQERKKAELIEKFNTEWRQQGLGPYSPVVVDEEMEDGELSAPVQTVKELGVGGLRGTRPTIKVCAQGITTWAEIDTGADVTICSWETALQLEILNWDVVSGLESRPKPVQVDKKTELAVAVVKRGQLCMEVEDVLYTVDATVYVLSSSCPFLLGIPEIGRLRLTLHISESGVIVTRALPVMRLCMRRRGYRKRRGPCCNRRRVSQRRMCK